MSHTYINCYAHIIFSTKGRRKLLDQDLQPRLWGYMAGIVREHGMKTICIGGVEDHAHLLIGLNGELGISKAVQAIKGNSSRWIKTTPGGSKSFAWQQGFGAFSIGKSNLQQAVAYIQGQPRHHRRVSFEQEFLAFLKKYDVDYDPKYVFG